MRVEYQIVGMAGNLRGFNDRGQRQVGLAVKVHKAKAFAKMFTFYFRHHAVQLVEINFVELLLPHIASRLPEL
eukprot:1197655-Pleurochrysis_carterae.AAC.1